MSDAKPLSEEEEGKLRVQLAAEPGLAALFTTLDAARRERDALRARVADLESACRSMVRAWDRNDPIAQGDAVDLLESVLDTTDTEHPVTGALHAAPVDDEPLTAEERAGLDEAWQDVRDGRVSPLSDALDTTDAEGGGE